MKFLLGLLCRAALLVAVAGFACGTAVIGFRVPAIGWCVLGVLAWQRHRSWKRRGGGYAYGTARVADALDLHAYDLLGGDGLILGRAAYTAGPTFGQAIRSLLTLPLSQSAAAAELFLGVFRGKGWGRGSIIRVRDYVHLMTCAMTGAGKGVSVLIPNLLSYVRSCVVTDPKCELFRITSKHRRRKFGHRIVRLDPFGLGGPGADSFNPLDLMDPNSPHLLDQARDLASMLVFRTGREHEPHWNDMAEVVLTVCIAYVAACEQTPGFRNLQTVRALVCNRHHFTEAMKRMQASHACGGMLSRLAASLSWLVDRELGSVLSSVQRHTNFLDSPAIAACTETSSFDPRRLRSDGQRMTVYLCLPADKLVSHAPLQRLWVGCLLRAVATARPDGRNPVMFFLDEVGNLGHIPALEDAVSLLRGYGVRLWFFFQSIAQITTCFGDKAPIFLDNIGTQQFFGVNRIESAEDISKRFGDATITNVSTNDTWGRSRSYGGGKGQEGVNVSSGGGVTVSELGRRLLKPEEIMCLPQDLAVVFHKNLPPIISKLLCYYNAPEFRWGGTGKSRGQGFGLLLRSACLLATGVLFALFATDLPTPEASYSHRPPSARVNRPSPVSIDQLPVIYGNEPVPDTPPLPYVAPGRSDGRYRAPMRAYPFLPGIPASSDDSPGSY